MDSEREKDAATERLPKKQSRVAQLSRSTCRGPPRKRVATSSNLFSVRDETGKGHHFENEEETVVAAQ